MMPVRLREAFIIFRSSVIKSFGGFDYVTLP